MDFKNINLKLGFLRGNVVTLMTGSALAQIISIISMPFLSRLYAPFNFGEYTLFLASAAILSAFVSCKYELAILLPKEKNDSINVIFLCMFIGLIMIILMFSIIIICEIFFDRLISDRVSLLTIFLIPVYSFFLAIYQVFYYWFNREKKYKVLSISRVITTALTALFSVTFSFFSEFGLIWGSLLAQVSVSIYMGYKFFCDVELEHVTIRRMLCLAKKYSAFPKYSILTNLIASVAEQLPVFFFTAFYGATVIGYFSLGQRCINTPISVLTQAVNDIFREKISTRFKNQKSFIDIFDATFVKLLKLSVIPLIVLFVFAPDIFALFFGDEWREAGIYTRILVPMYFLKIVDSPLSNVYIIVEKQKWGVWFQIFSIIILLTGMFLGHVFFGDARNTILFFAVSYIIICVWSLYANRKFSSIIDK